jgi:hypothetical protein
LVIQTCLYPARPANQICVAIAIAVADGVLSWTVGDLADLVLGNTTPKNLYIMFSLLSMDKLYFKVRAWSVAVSPSYSKSKAVDFKNNSDVTVFSTKYNILW